MNDLTLDEAIEIVEKFNILNRFRDGGKINHAIDLVIAAAKQNNNTSKLETAIKEIPPMEKR